MTFAQDLRFAFRTYKKNLGVTAVIVLTLGFGIGANTTVFTLVNAVLFRGLPFENAGNIMHISASNVTQSNPQARHGISYADFRDLRGRVKTFQDVAAFSWETFNVSDGTTMPERHEGARVSANSFGLLGQRIALGRDFMAGEDEPSAQLVTIIGHGVWKNRYGGDPNIIGRSIRINEVPATIVGVMPQGAKFPQNADMWLPLIPKADEERRDDRRLFLFGRLKANTTVPDAAAELNVMAQQLEKDNPKTNRGYGLRVEPYNDVANGGEIRVLFLSILGAVGFVLLIACANVANLLLARSAARAREMSLRAALGASRGRMIRQLLTESVVLGIAGGVLGLGIATQGVRMFEMAIAEVPKPYWIVFEFDATVFSYLAAVCVMTGILFGLFPALRASRADLNATLKEGSRGSAGLSRGWLSGALVITEVALSVVLLAGAGLMIRSFFALYDLHPGIDTSKVLTMRYVLPDAKYRDGTARERFGTELSDRIPAIAGVAVASLASHTPSGGSFGWQYELEGQTPVERERLPRVSGLVITGRYFEVLGAPLLQGRAFTGTDGAPGRGAVIVNESFARRSWPNADPVGKRIRLVRRDQPEGQWLTVVGVSRDIRQNSPNQRDVDPLIYVPFRQDPARSMVILARTNAEAASVTAALRRQVQTLDADLPVYNVWTLDEVMRRQRWAHSVFGTLFAIFASLALLMAAVGIYAVIAQGVSQRTQEIGVRVALGAGAAHVVKLVMKRGVVQLAAGLVIGLAGAYGLTRVISGLLIQVSATDSLTFAAATVLLLATGLLACALPARRALRVQPSTALRYE
jgi:predicted permease